MNIQQEQVTANSRRTRRARTASSLSEINVVPLVDVMLVLLIIFMVTAPMMQRGVDVNLPVSRRAQAINAERVFVTVPLSYRTDGIVQLGEEPVPIDVLHERIRQAMTTQEENEVFLRGDGEITLQELIAVMDKLKEGGVDRVGILSRVPSSS